MSLKLLSHGPDNHPDDRPDNHLPKKEKSRKSQKANCLFYKLFIWLIIYDSLGVKGAERGDNMQRRPAGWN